MFVTADSVDPELAEPYTDIDEQRTTTDPATNLTVSYRYIHGGFSGTAARFAFYFPAPSDYRGRFFHYTYPTFAQEDAGSDTIAFGISLGAYVVSANNAGGVAAAPVLGGYRVNAAAAKYSRVVAAGIYGADAPMRGYLYGASGGAYQTIGGIENTSGVWDGAVPMVPGTPNAIPSYQGAVMLGLRVLRDRLAGIADALEPGGTGDPYAGLTDEQRSVLREISTLGFPLRGWWQHADLDGGSFWMVAASVRAINPGYVDDFWTVPGYAGADPESSVGGDRVRFDAIVTHVGERSLTLSAVPAGDLTGCDLVITSGAAAGTSISFVLVDGTDATFRPGASPPVAGTLAPGDHVRLDNSWYLALQYYHRHQVPRSSDLYGWKPFRDGDGKPIHPQRTTLVGPILAGVSGGIATGRFDGKVIVLGSALDVEAFPWSVDWYRHQVEAVAGDAYDDMFRVWFMDNADHNPTTRTVAAEAHIVGYDGEMQQALLDLDTWVVDGVAPPASTNYRVTEDSQIEVSTDARERGGVQPVVTLAVASADASSERDVRVAVAAGEPLTFTMTALVPPGVGEIVRVEWDFASSGIFDVRSRLDRPAPEVQLTESHTYTETGTHFAVVRATAHRAGDTDAVHGLIQNLARVRVVVT